MLLLDMIIYKKFIDRINLQYPSLKPDMEPLTFKNHKRVLYFQLSEGQYFSKKGLNFSEKIEESFSQKNQSILGNNNAIEMFPMIEGKIPFHMLESEAVKEVERSQMFHETYFERYGEISLSPVPLSIEILDDSYKLELLRFFKGHFPKPVYERLYGIMQNENLCTLSSFYPSLPLRVMDLKSMPKETSLIWNEKTESKVIECWLREFSRIMALGFIPATKWSMMTGNCLLPQNMCLYGGFADLDSLVYVEEINKKSFLMESLAYSMMSLSNSIFLALENREIDSASKLERKWILDKDIFQKIKYLLSKDSPPPSIQDFFESDGNFQFLRSQNS